MAILRQFGSDAVFFQAAFADPVKEFVSDKTQVVCLNDRVAQWPPLSAWMAGANSMPPEVEVQPTDLGAFRLNHRDPIRVTLRQNRRQPAFKRLL